MLYTITYQEIFTSKDELLKRVEDIKTYDGFIYYQYDEIEYECLDNSMYDGYLLEWSIQVNNDIVNYNYKIK